MDVSSPSCLLYLLVSGQDPSIADIVGDGVVEEHCVLGHHPNVSTQRSLLHLGGRGEGSGRPTPNAKIPPKPNPTLSHEPHSLQAMCCRVTLHHRLSAVEGPDSALVLPREPWSVPTISAWGPGVMPFCHFWHSHQPAKGLWGLYAHPCPGEVLVPALSSAARPR